MTRTSKNGVLCDTLVEAMELGTAYGLYDLSLSTEEVSALESGAVLWTTDAEYVTRVTFEIQQPE